jgi:NAD-dependent dihydropyrimidine dehydrogenase PreA subunit
MTHLRIGLQGYPFLRFETCAAVRPKRATGSCVYRDEDLEYASSIPTSGTFNRWRALMTYVITEPCIGVKDTACVEVCPVDCIHPKKDAGGFADAQQLYIDPDTCIDCGACEPVCPVEAIFEGDSVPEQWKSYTQKNADYFKK